MSDQCRTMNFVATPTGRRLLKVSRRETTAAGGSVVVTAASNTDKALAGLFVRILRGLLRQQYRRADHMVL
jgi:hypothetical protein